MYDNLVVTPQSNASIIDCVAQGSEGAENCLVFKDVDGVPGFLRCELTTYVALSGCVLG